MLSQTKKVCTGVRTRQIVIGDNRRARRLFFVVSQLPIFSGTDPHKIMVALAGQLSGWPVSDNAGILTPVSVTTNQSVRTPGGDSFKLLSEISSCWQSLPRLTLNLYGVSIRARNVAITRLLLQANPKPVLNYPTHLVSFLPDFQR